MHENIVKVKYYLLQRPVDIISHQTIIDTNGFHRLILKHDTMMTIETLILLYSFCYFVSGKL